MTSRFGTILAVCVILLLAAGAATWLRYGSFDPCDWAEIDLAEETGWPRIAARADIRGRMLLDGIAEPGVHACLMSWWDIRANGAAAASTAQ
ncbi:MAG: hypothetical protein ACREDZ_01125 [Kiloniellales bacterium]